MLKIENISKTYSRGVIKKKWVPALKNISLNIHQGEILGLIGQSGSGKTTLTKILLKTIKPDSGRITTEGRDILSFKGETLREFRRSIQVIPQNSETALNPRFKIQKSLTEIFRLKSKKRFQEIQIDFLISMLEEVGLGEEHLDRYPYQLSGGELQRVMIARAMALEPKLIIADEATSNLDVLSQAQVIHLLLNLTRKNRSTMLFISHDIELVNVICHRVAILKKGCIDKIYIPNPDKPK